MTRADGRAAPLVRRPAATSPGEARGLPECRAQIAHSAVDPEQQRTAEKSSPGHDPPYGGRDVEQPTQGVPQFLALLGAFPVVFGFVGRPGPSGVPELPGLGHFGGRSQPENGVGSFLGLRNMCFVSL